MLEANADPACLGVVAWLLREQHAGSARVDLSLNQKRHATRLHLLPMAIEQGARGPVRGPAFADGTVEGRNAVHVKHRIELPRKRRACAVFADGGASHGERPARRERQSGVLDSFREIVGHGCAQHECTNVVRRLLERGEISS